MMCSSRSSVSASSARPAAASRTMSRPCRMWPISLPAAVYAAPCGLLLDLAQLADVVQDRAGHDQPLVQPRLHVGIVVVVLVGQIDARARHAQHVLQPAADEGVMIVRGGRQASAAPRDSLSADRRTRPRSAASAIRSRAIASSSSNIAGGSNRDLRLAHRRAKSRRPRRHRTTSRILRISSCGPKFVSR